MMKVKGIARHGSSIVQDTDEFENVRGTPRKLSQGGGDVFRGAEL